MVVVLPSGFEGVADALTQFGQNFRQARLIESAAAQRAREQERALAGAILSSPNVLQSLAPIVQGSPETLSALTELTGLNAEALTGVMLTPDQEAMARLQDDPEMFEDVVSTLGELLGQQPRTALEEARAGEAEAAGRRRGAEARTALGLPERAAQTEGAVLDAQEIQARLDSRRLRRSEELGLPETQAILAAQQADQALLSSELTTNALSATIALAERLPEAERQRLNLALSNPNFLRDIQFREGLDFERSMFLLRQAAQAGDPRAQAVEEINTVLKFQTELDSLIDRFSKAESDEERAFIQSRINFLRESIETLFPGAGRLGEATIDQGFFGGGELEFDPEGSGFPEELSLGDLAIIAMSEGAASFEEILRSEAFSQAQSEEQRMAREEIVSAISSGRLSSNVLDFGPGVLRQVPEGVEEGTALSVVRGRIATVQGNRQALADELESLQRDNSPTAEVRKRTLAAQINAIDQEIGGLQSTATALQRVIQGRSQPRGPTPLEVQRIREREGNR